MTDDPNPQDDWMPTTDFRWVIRPGPAGERVLQQKWTNKVGNVNWIDVRNADQDEPT